ncbi:16S rRNA (guanine527-N7)-methyltransferase [Catenibacillus scindens]|uniref:Ribosomal RNA small subunit methyltransferase G n=1 Tax=Catenibacillus scindens TaxID=673271 RepID=A0A7W8HD75_9FIRM|nr:16S rRNA (guanine(527)-N(7))-methyltransferase RsmG [Catenibacillus scindens]MBB5265527.1 16S rRNA (guanine527-N7)-methyltransferase [Catenibacillus scindens]
MRDLSKFKQGLDFIGISLSENQLDQFMKYYEMLVEKNKVMNLTAITEFDDVVEKHFIDSLLLAKTMDLTQPLKVIDLGTGAGFPGIPLKIAFPQLNIVLADSLNKRIRFLEEVIDALGIYEENFPVLAVHGRAEDLGRKTEYREKFDLCVSRAVANLATLSEYCLPFVKVGGYFVSYKSGHVDDEVKQSKRAIHILSSDISRCEKMTLPGTDVGRSFVIIRKNAPIQKKYPRKAGTPGKEPLV